jgi:hypothetical protein
MQFDPRTGGGPPPSLEPTGFFTGVQVLPVIVGVVIDYIATYAGNYAYFGVYLANKLAQRGELSREALFNYMISPEGLTIGFLIGALGTVLGGFFAARIAGQFCVKHGAFVGLGSLIVSFVEERMGDDASPVFMPEWFRALSILSVIPAGALGGYIADVFRGALARKP